MAFFRGQWTFLWIVAFFSTFLAPVWSTWSLRCCSCCRCCWCCWWYRNLTWLCIPTILSVVTGFTTNRAMSCVTISMFPGRFVSLLFWPSSLRTKRRRINNHWSHTFRNSPFTRMTDREDVPGICFNPTSSFVAIPTKVSKRLLREPTKLKCMSN